MNDSETKWFVEQLQKSVTKATPFLTTLPLEGRHRLQALMDQYSNYKANYVRNYVFDPAASNLSNLMYLYQNNIFSVREIGFSPMQVVQIYFDTATFDEIEKDVKVIVNTVIKD